MMTSIGVLKRDHASGITAIAVTKLNCEHSSATGNGVGSWDD